ncbi:hypothetical protein RS81_01135 [Microbacterium terrae]|uniref:Uncharacterized protein n=1 Tax=Microbacterium terrae TaxID=69369 RepID=A0A0M2HEJ3_9MICO|nr:hypothetical protein [Microbacterium terrae]KJL42633.1 hypothetical protein RS81_01135 [Microbacterium terrae]
MSSSPHTPSSWPSSAELLADPHHCPWCFSGLTGATCSACGLLVVDEEAPRVLELGRTMLACEQERRRLLAGIRQRSDALVAAAVEVHSTDSMFADDGSETIVAAAPTVSTTTTGSDPLAVLVDASAASTPAPAVMPTPPRLPAPSATPSPKKRRLTVPVVLLIVGVSLVGIAAIFFLTLAWFVAGIGVRALIIGGITLATIVGASLLRRRQLTATAEALAVLGVLLLALDAWAVRANDLFNAGGTDPLVYAGASAIVVAVVCRIWARLSGLRAPDLTAVLALLAGIALIVAGMVALPTGEALLIGLLGAAVGGLAHSLPAPWSSARRDAVLEREVLAWAGVAALAAAAIASVAVAPNEVSVPLWSAVAIALIAAAYTVLSVRASDASRLPSARILVGAVSSVGAVTLAGAGWQAALRSDEPVYALLLAPLLPVVVAVALDVLRRRLPILTPATIAAASVAALSTVVVFAVWLAEAYAVIAGGWHVWATDPFLVPAALVPVVLAPALPVIVAAAIAILFALAPGLGAPRVRDARLVAAASLVLAATARTGVPIVLVGSALVIAALAVWGLSRRPSRLHARIGWGVTAGAATITAYVAATATPWLWAIAVVAALVVPIAAAVVTRAAAPASAILAVTSIGAAAASALLAPAAIAAAMGVTADPGATLPLVQWIALVSLGIAAFAPLARLVRTAVAAAALALLAVSLTSLVLPPAPTGSVAALLGEPWAAIARGILITALLSAVAIGRTRIDASARIAAAFFVAGAAGGAAAAIASVAGATDATALTVGVTAAAVPAVAAIVALRVTAPSTEELRARLALDLGTVAVFAATSWQLSTPQVAWELAAITAALLAASATRGWAAPRAAAVSGFPTAPGEGAALTQAPRRLLVWAAIGAAWLALLQWLAIALGDGVALQVEAFTLAPAIALLVWAGALTWLRRHLEAAIAVGLSFGVGLFVPAASSAGDEGPRLGIYVAVAGVLCLALAWSPLRRLVAASVTGATVALFAVAMASVTLVTPISEPTIAWIAVPAAVALLAAVPFARNGSAAQKVFAQTAPPITLAIGASMVALAASGVWGTTAGAATITAALALLLAVHVAAAALDALPLAAGARWTSVAGAAAIGVAALPQVDGAVELLSLPIAGALFAGAALAMLRLSRLERPWPAREAAPWLAGLAMAIVPSVIAPLEGPRVWLVIAGGLLAALGIAVIEVAACSRLRAQSVAVLVFGALAMGAHAVIVAPGWDAVLPATVAGAGAVGLGAVVVWMRLDQRTTVAPLLAAAGSTLVVAAVVLRGDGGAPFTAVTAAVAAAVAVAAAAVLGMRDWQRWAAATAIGATAVALSTITVRFVAVADPLRHGLEPDVWATCAAGIVAAVTVSALRAGSSARVAGIARIGFSLSVAVFAAAELALLLAPGGDSAVRAAIVMAVLSVAGVIGYIARARVGEALLRTAVASAVLFAAAALFLAGTSPVEVLTVAPALALTAVGARHLQLHSTARSWPTLGPGLALLTVPSLLHDFTGSDLWRIVGLGVVAVALIVVGAVRHLQAPLVIGSAVVLLHALAQLWPWISANYSAVPWWLWLGTGGALLIALAARYEKNMRAMRGAVTAVTGLR